VGDPELPALGSLDESRESPITQTEPQPHQLLVQSVVSRASLRAAQRKSVELQEPPILAATEEDAAAPDAELSAMKRQVSDAIVKSSDNGDLLAALQTADADNKEAAAEERSPSSPSQKDRSLSTNLLDVGQDADIEDLRDKMFIKLQKSLSDGNLEKELFQIQQSKEKEISQDVREKAFAALTQGHGDGNLAMAIDDITQARSGPTSPVNQGQVSVALEKETDQGQLSSEVGKDTRDKVLSTLIRAQQSGELEKTIQAISQGYELEASQEQALSALAQAQRDGRLDATLEELSCERDRTLVLAALSQALSDGRLAEILQGGTQATSSKEEVQAPAERPPSSKTGTKDRPPSATPGRYLIIHDQLPVNALWSRKSDTVAKLEKDTCVDVEEVSQERDGGRVRARLVEPAGWISLNLKDKVFATKVEVEEAAKAHEEVFAPSLLSQPQVAVEFPPGPLGLKADWSTGQIINVKPSGSAAPLGVQDAWMIVGVNGQPYTEALLDETREAGGSFVLTFFTGFADEAPNANAET
jgi:hypothetical protein